MTAQIHSLGAYREMKNPILRTQNATSSAEVVPLHKWIAAKVCDAWAKRYHGLSDEVVKAQFEMRMTFLITEIIQETDLATAHSMLSARLRAIEATERAGF